MSTYKELEKIFEHLQKRSLELFADGEKQRNKLNEAVVQAWKQFSRISVANNLDEAVKMAESAQALMATVLFDNQRHNDG